MSGCLVCPVCRRRKEENALIREGGAYRCCSGHSFDTARAGYVNLTLSQQSSKKRHGDDKQMLISRRSFLEKGFYEPLADAVTECVTSLAGESAVVVDAGCGEGYYTQRIRRALPRADIYGVDISKDALILAAKRGADITLTAASAAELPLASGCADVLLSIFAPVFPEEFARVLKPGGTLIRAVPLEDHLYGLKSAIYDNAYKNPPESGELPGFQLDRIKRLGFELSLESREDIEALFMMTPYYYKTSRADQEKLLSRTSLRTQAEFGVIVSKAAKI